MALDGQLPVSKVPGATLEILAAATDAYKTVSSQVFRTVFLIAIAFGVIGPITAFLWPDREDSKIHVVAKTLHHWSEEEKLEAEMLEEKIHENTAASMVDRNSMCDL